MNTHLPKMLVTTTIFAVLVSVAGSSEYGAQVTKKTIRAADGIPIVCEVRGSGDTTLIFLHGWCGDREYWKNQVGVFAADYVVVALDQAGHGESGKERKSWTTSSLASDVESVVKELGLKKVILVGHSMGGQVSLMTAKRMPGTVIGVIGVDTLQDAEFKMPEEMTKQFLESFKTDFKGTLNTAFPSMLHEKVDPELKKWILSRAEAQDQKMALGLMQDLFGLDLKELLKDVKVPVRCINSGGGYPFHTPTSIAVNKKYADYDAVTIDEVGHYPMLEKPAEFNKSLSAVLKQFKGGK